MNAMTDNALGAISWPDRIEHYRRVIGRSAFMSYEDGWAFGVWFLGNSWAVKSGYYGGFPHGYLRKMKALFPGKSCVLHLLSGMADTVEFPAETLDIRPEMNPTYL
jgi:hypothetical protein